MNVMCFLIEKKLTTEKSEENNAHRYTHKSKRKKKKKKMFHAGSVTCTNYDVVMECATEETR